MTYIEGRDVSSWQEDVPDFTASEFVVVKATEGTTYMNPKHGSQVANARRLGLVVGHYHFVNEHSPIPEQVVWFLSNVPDDPAEFLVLDWEIEAVTDAHKDEFLRAVQVARPHQSVLLYCNAQFWDRSSKFAGDGLWVAAWDKEKGDPGILPWVIHQYTANPYDKNVAAFPTREAFADWVAAKAPRSAYVVQAGDTVQGILDTHGLTLSQLEEWNAQLLLPGRPLWIEDVVLPPPPTEPPPPPPPPPVPVPTDPYAAGLPVAGHDEPSAKPLQLELKRVGYLSTSVPLADNYGPQTRAAVKAFYTANADQGFIPDEHIGPLGWAHLRTEPTGSYQVPVPPPPPHGGFEPAHNYTRTTWSGKTINARTREMLKIADGLLDAYEWDPVVTQGSYNAGGVSASAGTHDGGGVVDIRTSTMTDTGAWQCVQALRKAGFAAWFRVPAEGFPKHIHAVAIGDREMSAAAKKQVAAYFAGRNGLANNGPDSAPAFVGRPYPAWANKYK